MISETINGIEYFFESNSTCFSPRQVDIGTLAMMFFAEIKETDKVLDLGCGYGVVGIVAAKSSRPENVYMVDINEEALICAKKIVV